MATNNSTTPITTGPTSGYTPTTSVVNKHGTNLGKDDFLKLMMIQLQHQDPLSPQDPSQYLAQLAQFTSVEQQTNTAESTANSLAATRQTAAVALLGKNVTYIDGNGATHTGVVEKVTTGSNGPTLTVSGLGGVLPSEISTIS